MRLTRITALAASAILSVSVLGVVSAQQENPRIHGERPYIGVVVERSEDGVLITEVLADSPAAEAGLLAGDLVVSVNGVSVADQAGVIGALRDMEIDIEVGSVITLDVVRGGETLTLSLTLAELPEGMARDRMEMLRERLAERGALGQLVQRRLGVSFEMTDAGLEVVEVLSDSRAAEVGLQAGDVITAVDGTAINPDSTLRAALMDHAPGDTVTFSVLRDGATTEITWEIPTLRDVIPQLRDMPFREGRRFGGAGAPFADPTATPGA